MRPLDALRATRRALALAIRDRDAMAETLTITQELCTKLRNELLAYKQSQALPGLGWDCPNCRAFNGTVQDPNMAACRCCDAPRPS